jgi:NAD(P)-dependent dehydrogenase (short-subunit alcohol dehydrogenase family)
MEITGKVALVAGATSGLGLATAELLATRGAKVALLGRRGDLARKLAGSLDAEAIGVEADIADAQAVAAAIAETVGHFGALHININTAGIIADVPVIRDGAATPLGEFERLVVTNLVGTFNVMTQSAAAMLANTPDEDGQRGVIVNTSSGAAYEGNGGHTGYAATKAGIVGMTLPASRNLTPHGIRVNTIVAGGFDTPILDFATPESLAEIVKEFAGPQRLGRPEEFARFAAHIVENNYLNAAALRLDAGYRIAA